MIFSFLVAAQGSIQMWWVTQVPTTAHHQLLSEPWFISKGQIPGALHSKGFLWRTRLQAGAWLFEACGRQMQ